MAESTLESLLGTRIAHYRALKGLTQAELAKKVGISTIYVSHIETGTKRPTFKVTVKIAKALSVDWRTLTISPLSKKIDSLNISDKEKNALNSVLGEIDKLL